MPYRDLGTLLCTTMLGRAARCKPSGPRPSTLAARQQTPVGGRGATPVQSSRSRNSSICAPESSTVIRLASTLKPTFSSTRRDAAWSTVTTA